MHRKIAFPVIVVFVFVSACNVNDSVGGEKPQIIFGKEINGISLGDEQTKVFKRLGEPSSFLGFALTGGRFIYGDSLIITTHLLPGSEPEAGSNLKEFTGVTAIEIQNSFSGTTEDDIGIGSLRTEVILSLGNPELSIEGSVDPMGITDYFLIEGNELAFLYQKGQIISMTYSFPNVLKKSSE